MRLDFLTTGCHGIDKLLDGGIPLHQIVLVYGEAGSGKTILSMQCAVEAAGRGCKILYVDADQSFSSNRMENLVGGGQLAEGIVLFRPEHFEDQIRILENVENLVTKTPTLLIVDSVTGLYRMGGNNPEEYFLRDRELNRQLARLRILASRFAMWVILTGQVHASPSRGWQVEPVATRTLRHWADLILRLSKTPRSGVRDCILEKKSGRETSNGHCLFKITESGIEDA